MRIKLWPTAIYLAGPMRGYPRYNHDVFARYETVLRGMGFVVVSPREHDIENGFDPDNGADPTPEELNGIMKWCCEAVAECEGVVVLPGFEQSWGCITELQLAMSLNKPIYCIPEDKSGPLTRISDDRIREAIRNFHDVISTPPKSPKPSQYTRHNSGKVQVSQIPIAVLLGAARVLSWGASKYESWNWTKGGPWSTAFDSLMRHLIAWFYCRLENDTESGMHHLDHALCNLFFLRHWTLVRDGEDDRPPLSTDFNTCMETHYGTVRSSSEDDPT